MPIITCTTCGSDELQRDPMAPPQAETITVICLDCGNQFEREPRLSCPRCASDDIERGVYEGWAYDDIEEARRIRHGERQAHQFSSSDSARLPSQPSV